MRSPRRADPQPLIGVIGGSGFYSLGVEVIKTIDIVEEVPGWPFGPTSSPIVIGALPTGQQLAFLARHGVGHTISPSEVPNKSNIAALKHIGVQAIVAFSAVGSLREEIKPRDLILPSQIIDRTKGLRDSTYFGNGVVAHAMFGDPFDNELIGLLAPLIKKQLTEAGLDKDVTLHEDKTVVCMEGPAFSTRAESNFYRQIGGDAINMCVYLSSFSHARRSAIPESKLAREAEMSYALILTSTDYDAWRVSEKPVTVEEVMATLKANVEISKLVTQTVLAQLSDAIAQGQKKSSFKGSMRYSIMGKPDGRPAETVRALSYVLPEYFK